MLKVSVNSRHFNDYEAWPLGNEISNTYTGTGGPEWGQDTCNGNCSTPHAMQSLPTRHGMPAIKIPQKEASEAALWKQSCLPLAWPKINVCWKNGMTKHSKAVSPASHFTDAAACMLICVSACMHTHEDQRSPSLLPTAWSATSSSTWRPARNAEYSVLQTY